MGDRLSELGEDTVVVLVTFTKPENVASYSATRDLPFPILVDPEREAYRAFGLGRGSLSRIWGLRSARRYFEILRADGTANLAKPTEDTRQLGGDFVIDPNGTLTYGFWSDGPADRPSIEDLIAAIRRKG